MKTSSLRFRPLAAAILCTMIAPLLPTLNAQTATTDPVGFITVPLAPDSDSYTYLPFKRTPAFAGAASGAISSNAIPVSGTPFTANQFVYVAGAQPNRYYVFLNSGTKLGSYYTVTANTASSITIDSNGDDLSAAIIAGITFQVIPYDTLATLFPAGQGVDASTSHSLASRQTEILIPDSQTPGTDLASSVSYYYFSGASGAGPGWRKAGVSGTLANDDYLFPDLPFIVRHKAGSAGSNLTFMGTVQMATLSTPIGTNAASTNQDNAVALPIAANLTLSESKLWESGAFAGSSSHSLASRGDEVLIYDNAALGHDKAADTSYYYFTGASGAGPGWRKAGLSGTVANSDVVIKPGFGLVIRKKSAGPVATSTWSVKPPYVP